MTSTASVAPKVPVHFLDKSYECFTIVLMSKIDFFFDFRPLATSEVGSEINLLPYIEAAEELSNSAIKSKIA